MSAKKSGPSKTIHNDLVVRVAFPLEIAPTNLIERVKTRSKPHGSIGKYVGKLIANDLEEKKS